MQIKTPRENENKHANQTKLKRTQNKLNIKWRRQFANQDLNGFINGLRF